MELEALKLSEEVLVGVLKQSYEDTEELEQTSRVEWQETKELLEHKKSSLFEQISILESEVFSAHEKIAAIDGRIQGYWKSLFVEFYEVYCPSKVSLVDQILQVAPRQDVLIQLEVVYGSTLQPDDAFIAHLENQKNKIWEQIADAELILARTVDATEQVKRELYFPSVDGWRFKHGVEGIYFATRNFWLESFEARAVVSVVQGVKNPRIMVEVNDIGAISFRFFNCALHGEKGTKVPSLRIEQLDIKVKFTITLPLEFQKHRWRMSKHFKFKILQLDSVTKGTIKLPQSILRMIMNQFLPGLIKRELLTLIPVELGHFLMKGLEAEKPLTIDFDFSLFGVPSINILDSTIDSVYESDADICLGIDLAQAKIWVDVQRRLGNMYKEKVPFPSKKKSLWPGPLISVLSIIDYYEKHSRFNNWPKLLDIWKDIYDRYCRVLQLPRVDVQGLFSCISILTKKPMVFKTCLSNANVFTSIDMALLLAQQLMIVHAENLHKNHSKRKSVTKPLAMMKKEIDTWYSEAMIPVTYIKQLMYSTSMKLKGNSKAGFFDVAIHDFELQGPVAVTIPFQGDHFPPTYFAVDTSVSEEVSSFNICLAVDNHEPAFMLFLEKLESGVFFDVKSFMCSKMMNYMNDQLQPKRLGSRKRSNSAPETSFKSDGDFVGTKKDDTSLANFMQYFLGDELEDTLPIINLGFKHHADKTFMLAGQTHASALVKTTAKRFGGKGKLQNVLAFVETAMKSNGMLDTLSKYLCKEDFDLDFEFMLQGTVKHQQLIASLAQQNHQTTFSGSINLIELIEDVF